MKLYEWAQAILAALTIAAFIGTMIFVIMR